MGMCVSCEEAEDAAAAAAVAPPVFARIVMPDGTLREFAGPVSAGQALGKEEARTSFICDADEMDFDGYVSAVADGEKLRPGKLYFVLPPSMLRRPLHAEDMAMLAVRANKATLVARGRNSRGAADPWASDAGSAVEKGYVMKKKGGGRARKCIASLSAIPE